MTCGRAMGKSAGSYGGRGSAAHRGGGNGGRAGGAPKDPLQHVPKFRYFSKSTLSPYPTEDGCPFYLGDADDEKSFFRKGFIAKNVVGPDNCEALWRLGMAVALYSSACDVGGGALLGHVDEHGRVSDKTGLKQLGDLLRSPQGSRFLRAVKTLNVGVGGRVPRREAKEAMKVYVKFLTGNAEQIRKAVSRAASFTAKVYQASMCLAEHLDLAICPTEWANAMQGGKNQPAAAQKWIRDPKDQEKLIEALTDSFVQKMDASKKPKGAKRAAADSSDEEDEDDASSAASKPEAGSRGSDDEDMSGSEASGSEARKPEHDASGESSDDKSDAKKRKSRASAGPAKAGRTAKAARRGASRTRKGDESTEDSERPTKKKKIQRAGQGENLKKDKEPKAGRRADASEAAGVDDAKGKKKEKTIGSDEVGKSKKKPGRKADGSEKAVAPPRRGPPPPEKNPEMKVNEGKLQLALTEWRESDLQKVSAALEMALTNTVNLGDAAR